MSTNATSVSTALVKNVSKIFIKLKYKTAAQDTILSSTASSTTTTTVTTILKTLESMTSSATSQMKNETSTTINNSTTTVLHSTTATRIPSFSVATDFCELTHHVSFCKYMATCIFFGYLLRLFVMPFVIHRIEKLKHQLRGDYNFSLVWLWLIATLPFIDIIEFIATGNTQVYTRAISLFNTIALVMTLYTIAKYIYYYGHTKDNYRNYVTSITFIIVWITLVSTRSMLSKIERKRGGETHKSSLFPIYFLIYAMFAIVQVFKNVTNSTGRCLTHASFGFWLLSAFFLSSYQLVISSHKFDYLHYRTFFEISTLLVILLQNVYYRDDRHKRQLISTITNDDQEMVTNPAKSSIVKNKRGFDPFSREFSNSGYLYFKDEENAIDEATLSKQQNPVISPKALVDEDETYFDRNQITKKLSNSAASISNFFSKKQTGVEYNDAIQTKERSSSRRSKIGIFFSYSNNRMWMMILCAFCAVYYIFAYVTLVRAVEHSFVIVIAPLVHPITITVAYIVKRHCCFNNNNNNQN